VTTDVPRLALEDRPRFAAKMIAVWRWHHMAQGEELSVTVMPGEWPDGVPHEVKGVPIVENDGIGGPGSFLVLGKVGGKWRGAYQLAVRMWFEARCATEDLATASFYMEVDDDRSLKLWMAPDPETGDVPMWTMPPGGAR
jgi:hypothetical protein